MGRYKEYKIKCRSRSTRLRSEDTCIASEKVKNEKVEEVTNQLKNLSTEHNTSLEVSSGIEEDCTDILSNVVDSSSFDNYDQSSTWEEEEKSLLRSIDRVLHDKANFAESLMQNPTHQSTPIKEVEVHEPNSNILKRKASEVMQSAIYLPAGFDQLNMYNDDGTITVSIAPKNYPESILTDKVHKMVIEELRHLGKKLNEKHIVCGTQEEGGIINVTCGNKRTAEWIAAGIKDRADIWRRASIADIKITPLKALGVLLEKFFLQFTIKITWDEAYKILKRSPLIPRKAVNEWKMAKEITLTGMQAGWSKWLFLASEETINWMETRRHRYVKLGGLICDQAKISILDPSKLKHSKAEPTVDPEVRAVFDEKRDEALSRVDRYWDLVDARENAESPSMQIN